MCSRHDSRLPRQAQLRPTRQAGVVKKQRMETEVVTSVESREVECGAVVVVEWGGVTQTVDDHVDIQRNLMLINSLVTT